eukprot:10315875-Alexandrium_andersonii.AAC.1
MSQVLGAPCKSVLPWVTRQALGQMQPASARPTLVQKQTAGRGIECLHRMCLMSHVQRHMVPM